jgi:hypothetical protein
MLTQQQLYVLGQMARGERPDACISEGCPALVDVGGKRVRRQIMDALCRRGFIAVIVPPPWADDPDPRYVITDAGRAALEAPGD